MLHNRPENLSFFASPSNILSDRNSISEKDLGVTFIPDMSAMDEMENGKLVKLNWTGASFPIYSQILIHKDKNMNKAITEFVNIIDGKIYNK